jgi:hypothetical protein
MNRTIMNKVRCMLFDSNSDLRLWGEAFKTAIFIINRVTTSLGKKTPYELHTGVIPTGINLRRFGCVGYVHVPEELRSKLEPRSVKMVFAGYDVNKKGYRMFNPETESFHVSRDVTFNEDENWNKGPCIYDDADLIDEIIAAQGDVQDDTWVAEADAEREESESDDSFQTGDDEIGDEVSEVDLDGADDEVGENVEIDVREVEEVEEGANAVPEMVGAFPFPRRSTRTSNPDPYHTTHYTAHRAITEPSSYHDYLKMSETEKIPWKKAMDKEYNSIMENQTYRLVPLPNDRKAIASFWTFKDKKNAAGETEKLKARIVASGNRQEKGIDFGETYAPVLHFNSFRVIMAIATQLNLFMSQMDVQTAFLNGKLDEEIYMKQMPGYVDSEFPNHVCLLNKTIYGLKQSPRMWNKMVDEFLQECGFVPLISDPCLYLKKDDLGIHIIGLFVDDILQAATDTASLQKMRLLLEKRFKMTFLGEPKFCLGIEIERNMELKTTKIGLAGYTKKILNMFGFQDCNSVRTPQELNGKIPKAKDPSEIVDPDNYCRAVGCLVYLMSRTRPDIACAVRAVSEHLAAPTIAAWAAVKRIFRYLQGSIEEGFTYHASEKGFQISGQSDADWGSCINTRRSVSAVLVYLGDNLIMWRSKKQMTTALSSTEAEYMALTETFKEVIWLEQLMGELGLKEKGPIPVYEDNQGCILLAKNPIILSRSKHIDIRHHFIREKVASGLIEIIHKPTKEMTADALTKAITWESFQKHRKSMGLGGLELSESVES